MRGMGGSLELMEMVGGGTEVAADYRQKWIKMVTMSTAAASVGDYINQPHIDQSVSPGETTTDPCEGCEKSSLTRQGYGIGSAGSNKA